MFRRKIGQNVFFILSYFCPNIIVRTILEKRGHNIFVNIYYIISFSCFLVLLLLFSSLLLLIAILLSVLVFYSLPAATAVCSLNKDRRGRMP
jgi:hypothetical protein